MTQSQLLQSYKEDVEACTQKAQEHLKLSSDVLTFRPAADKWNVLECYEHMNRFGALYLQFFEEALAKAKPSQSDLEHRSGWLGAWAIRSMDTKENGVKSPMKTFKYMNPLGDQVEETVIQQFIRQQAGMMEVLKQAHGLNIDGVRSRTTLKLLKFKMSDALGFIINHNKRHLVQAQRIIDGLLVEG